MVEKTAACVVGELVRALDIVGEFEREVEILQCVVVRRLECLNKGSVGRSVSGNPCGILSEDVLGHEVGVVGVEQLSFSPVEVDFGFAGFGELEFDDPPDLIDVGEHRVTDSGSTGVRQRDGDVVRFNGGLDSFHAMVRLGAGVLLTPAADVVLVVAAGMAPDANEEQAATASAAKERST